MRISEVAVDAVFTPRGAGLCGGAASPAESTARTSSPRLPI